MAVRTLLGSASVALLGVALVALAPEHTLIATPTLTAAPAASDTSTSTLDDQTDLAVTVYNSDLALVRDTRSLRLGPGVTDLHFMDIAATVNPASVHFRSLTDPSRVNVLEQNYEYDLLEPDKLLRKFVGRDVTLVRRKTDQGTTTEEAVKAHLLSYNNAPVWRINGEIVTGMQADHIRFPELPGNLYSRPTLIWTLNNSGSGQHRVEASYLAQKLSWSADYVLTVARDDKAGDLDGWVTVVNGSGTAFRNAKLQFVAGDLNRVRGAMVNAQRLEDKRMAMDAAAPAMSQESFSDYHLYSMDRKTSVNNNETKQASQHDECDRLSCCETIRRRRAGVLLPESTASWIAAEGCGAGLLPVEERGQGRPRHADAEWNGARLSVRLEGRHSVRWRGSYRPHAKGRDDQSENR